MKQIVVSASGKLMLLGEHSVVYNRPCLVTAVGQRMRVSVELSDEAEFQLDAPDVQVTGYKKSISELGNGEVPKGAKFVEFAVKNFSEKYPFKQGLKIETTSEFLSKLGFGSSSASTVCIIKALSELLNLKLSNKEIFELAYKTVLDIQGKGSGFDVAAAVYGGTLYFVTGGKVIEPLPIESLPMIVGYSGVKADTVTLINQVKERMLKEPEVIENIYNQITLLVEGAKKQLLKKDWQKFGEFMNKDQICLRELGVSTDKLDAMIDGAIEAGAYGAKLSGAGGGDCMIAFAPVDKREEVAKNIEKAGGEVININTNVSGVREER